MLEAQFADVPGPIKLTVNASFVFTADIGKTERVSVTLYLPRVSVVGGHIYVYKVDISDIFQGLKGYVSNSVSVLADADGTPSSLIGNTCVILGGGIKKSEWQGVDDITNKLYNNPKALLWSRKPIGITDDVPVYRVYMSELKNSGLYFISDDSYLSLGGVGPSFPFSALKPNCHLRYANLQDLSTPGNYYVHTLINYVDTITCRFNVLADPVCEQLYLITYINSYGVKECLLITGEAKYVPAFTERESIVQMDEYEQMRNIPAESTIREKLTVQTGVQSPDRQRSFRDMLVSPLVWFTDENDNKRRCKITCEGYELQLIQRKPFNLTLNVDFMDEDTCVI